MYQEYSVSRAEAQLKQMEKVLTQQSHSRELELSAMREEVVSLKKVFLLLHLMIHRSEPWRLKDEKPNADTMSAR